MYFWLFIYFSLFSEQRREVASDFEFSRTEELCLFTIFWKSRERRKFHKNNFIIIFTSIFLSYKLILFQICRTQWLRSFLVLFATGQQLKLLPHSCVSIPLTSLCTYAITWILNYILTYHEVMRSHFLKFYF